MASALAIYSGSALDGARRWVDLPADERRRRAVTAARDRDLSELWSLTSAHLTLHGKAGARVSPRTLEAYEGGVKALLAGWQGVSLIRPTPDDGAMLVRTWEEQQLSTSTIQVRLAGIRALYRALRWAGATDGDPFRDVRPARDPTPAYEKRKPYRDLDVERLCAAADPSDRVLILLGAHAGLRIFEIMALQWVDIDLPNRRLTVQCGKGRKRRETVIGSTLAAALTAIQQPAGYVITAYRTTHQARNRIRSLCERAGVDYKAAHSLRHTAGTRLMRESRDLDRVARFLGHAQVETSRIYSKFSDELLEQSVGSW